MRCAPYAAPGAAPQLRASDVAGLVAGPNIRLAQRLALGVPALLLAGAYISQYGFGLFPCEMCWWQRWPHFAAVALALIATMASPLKLGPRQLWIALAALAVLTSGLIGVFHAGVEYGWWEGITTCASPVASGGNSLDAILAAPLVRCDVTPFHFLGLSMAGWNAVLSIGAAIAILVLLARREKA